MGFLENKACLERLGTEVVLVIKVREEIQVPWLREVSLPAMTMELHSQL